MLERWKTIYPEKFPSENAVYRQIRRGDTIFISSACSEPQYLIHGLIRFMKSNPKSFHNAEIIGVKSLGVAPYATERFRHNLRHNSFFIGDGNRESVTQGAADYTPVFLSQVPNLFYSGKDRIDVALIQTSLPDKHGFMNLGVSVDIGKVAIEKASCVIAQVNRNMPRVHGDGFIRIEDINFIINHDEEIPEYAPETKSDITEKIGKYVAHIVDDGDTIQVGYGSLPNAILNSLNNKKHLGVHTELLTDGIVDLMKKGIIDNSRKTIDRGKTIATFCMGSKETYEYIDDNPSIEFRTIDYTNDPLIIARHENITAINSALEIDLTGQASAESIGQVMYSGIGGQADFMRGAILSRSGKSILAIKSTAKNDEVSRILPVLSQGAGVTLLRGDVHYVITEYGIAYLHGKSIRERALELIAIAHPKFRRRLAEAAKKLGFIYPDQVILDGERGRYPEDLENYRQTKSGLEVLLRPIKITDESLLNDFLHNLSDRSLYLRFISKRHEIPHERLQEMVAIDYTKELTIVAAIGSKDVCEQFVGVAQYYIDPDKYMAEVAFAVRDDYQNQGVGTVLLSYITVLAKRNGLHGFTAEVLAENSAMLHVFEKGGFEIEKHLLAGLYEMNMKFK